MFGKQFDISNEIFNDELFIIILFPVILKMVEKCVLT